MEPNSIREMYSLCTFVVPEQVLFTAPAQPSHAQNEFVIWVKRRSNPFFHICVVCDPTTCLSYTKISRVYRALALNYEAPKRPVTLIANHLLGEDSVVVAGHPIFEAFVLECYETCDQLP